MIYSIFYQLSYQRCDGLEYVVLFAGGLAAGLSSSLLGIGGGFILVPVFFLIGVHPAVTGASSIAIIATVTAISSIHYHKNGKVSIKPAFQVLSGAVAGGLLGVITVHLIKDPKLLEIIMEAGFLLLVLIMIIRMIIDVGFKTERKKSPAPTATKGILIGLIVGFVSVILGVGGGFIYVPTFLYLYGLPAQVAVGTSLSVIAVANGLATLENLFINHTVSLFYYLIALSGAVIGIKVSTRIELSAYLRKMLFLGILLFIFVENILKLIF